MLQPGLRILPPRRNGSGSDPRKNLDNTLEKTAGIGPSLIQFININFFSLSMPIDKHVEKITGILLLYYRFGT